MCEAGPAEEVSEEAKFAERLQHLDLLASSWLDDVPNEHETQVQQSGVYVYMYMGLCAYVHMCICVYPLVRGSLAPEK